MQTVKYCRRLVSLLGLFAVWSCSQGPATKTDSPAAGTSASDPNSSTATKDGGTSPTKQALGDQLQADLIAYGVSDAQAASLVKAGQASAGAALQDTTFSEDTVAFVAAVMADVTKEGIDPAKLTELPGVISAASTKVTVAELQKETIPAADAATLVGDVVGEVTKALDEIGMPDGHLGEVVGAVSQRTTSVVTQGEAPTAFQDDAIAQSVSSAVSHLGDAGASDAQVAELVGQINERTMDEVLGGKSIGGDRIQILGAAIADASISGADTLPTFNDVAALAEQASQGLVKSYMKDDKFKDADKLSEVAGPLADQVFESSSKFQGVDVDQLPGITKALSSGLVSAAGSGHDAAIYKKLAELGTSAAIKGAGDRPDFDQSKLGVIAAAGGEGAMQGAGKIPDFKNFGEVAASASGAAIQASALLPKFDLAKMAAFAAAVSGGVMKGAPTGGDFAAIAQSSSQEIMTVVATKVLKFDADNLNDLAKQVTSGAIAGLANHKDIDATKISNVGSAAAAGVVSGAGAFSNIDEAKLAEISKHASDGIVASAAQNLPGKVDATVLQNAAATGAASGAGDADKLKQCLDKDGAWDPQSKLCQPKAPTDGSSTPPATPEFLCKADNNGVLVNGVCHHFAAEKANCEEHGGSFSEATHTCAVVAAAPNYDNAIASCLAANKSWNDQTHICSDQGTAADPYAAARATCVATSGKHWNNDSHTCEANQPPVDPFAAQKAACAMEMSKHWNNDAHTCDANPPPVDPYATQKATCAMDTSKHWNNDSHTCDANPPPVDPYAAQKTACAMDTSKHWNNDAHTCDANASSSPWVMKSCPQFMALPDTDKGIYKTGFQSAKNTDPSTHFCSHEETTACSTFGANGHFMVDDATPGFCALPPQ